MKKITIANSIKASIIGFVVGSTCIVSGVLATDLTVTKTFTDGEILTAADLNNTFDEVEAAVTDNHNRILSNELDIGNHEVRIAVIETRLGSSKTGFVTIPVAAFRPVDSSTTFVGKASNPFLNMTGGTLEMVAQLNIPEGATITGISMRAWDVSATNFTTIELRQFTGGATTTLVTSVATTAAEASGSYVKEDNTLAESVSYSGTSHPFYYLVYKVDFAANIAGPGIYAARVTYTYQ